MNLEELKKFPLIEICNYLGLKIVKHGYGGNFKVLDYGGLIIKNNYFYRHSTGEKGGVIDFIMLVEQCSFKEALQLLITMDRSYTDNTRLQKTVTNTIEKRSDFICPVLIEDEQITNYLLSRGIASRIIQQEIESQRIKGVMYNNHVNVAFICYDILQPIIKGIILRGIHSPFKGIYKGSQGNIGYSIIPKQSFRCLYIFEAPIDLLSYISLYQYDPSAAYVAMGGVKPSVIENFTKNFDVKVMVCCTDNDEAGHNFYNKLQNEYKHMRIRRHTPIQKDWNEDLQSQK